VTPGSAGPAVRWAAGPFRFALACDDPPVRALAAAVFRPWPAADASEPTRSWRIDRVNGAMSDPEWRVRSSAGAETLVSSEERAVRVVEFGAVGAILESPGIIAHGALVAWGGRGILLVGRGEAGKSTLACALWARGAALLGDDVALLDRASVDARPAPRRVSLRPASRALLGDALFDRIRQGPSSVALADACLFHPEEIEPRPRPASVRLAAMVFLARRGSAAAAARPLALPRAHALLALLPYTTLVSGTPLGESIRMLAPLADAVPAFDLARGPLDRMVAAVEALAGPASST
jgi:hypothetical protein